MCDGTRFLPRPSPTDPPTALKHPNRRLLALLGASLLLSLPASAQTLGDVLSQYESGLGFERHTYHSEPLGDVPFYFLGRGNR
jgi:hypothetical protein